MPVFHIDGKGVAMVEASGPWKEGRMGAATLCYLAPPPAMLTWVMRHHAAVGIRATLAGAVETEHRRRAAERNWDLACGTGDAAEAAALEAIDGNTGRGLPAPVVAEARCEPGRWLYRLVPHAGHVAGPGAIDPQSLPLHPVDDAAGLGDRMDRLASAGGWSIWRLDEAALSALGEAGHAALLDRLGQDHARIWCAPVRDVLQWAR